MAVVNLSALVQFNIVGLSLLARAARPVAPRQRAPLAYGDRMIKINFRTTTPGYDRWKAAALAYRDSGYGISDATRRLLQLAPGAAPPGAPTTPSAAAALVGEVAAVEMDNDEVVAICADAERIRLNASQFTSDPPAPPVGHPIALVTDDAAGDDHRAGPGDPAAECVLTGIVEQLSALARARGCEISLAVKPTQATSPAWPATR